MKQNTPIQVSEITLVPIKPKGDGLLAFVSFVLDGRIYVGDVGIHVRPNGQYRLVYPARVLSNGKLVSAIHPIDRTTGDEIERAVVQAYETLIRKCAEKSHVNSPSVS